MSQQDFDNFKQQIKDWMAKYKVGSAKHWDGATVFRQMDIAGRVRTGKVMLYDPETGKRVKHPYNHITWVHSLLRRHIILLNVISNE